MRLSIIIPAYNEEKELPGCLASVDAAIHQLREEGCDLPEVEIIVADNNSSDATAEIARVHDATVVFEPVNQISRARNAGAAVAGGDWLLFIDADSRLHPRTLADLLTAITSDHYVGGGCPVALEPAPWWGRTVVGAWNLLSRMTRWAAGSFLFCQANAFGKLDGFSLELYAGEEIDFSRRLKRWGRQQGLKVVILRTHPHISSGRKFELYRKRDGLMLCLRALLQPRKTLQNKDKLYLYYEDRR